ncbi:hypothetical protein K438DRAFT_1952495 [Mycena galopus ATCC 62051]|nr:hypothetical protein K438DRAFT_1952495 [Mycena galopus ATCC 62051]
MRRKRGSPSSLPPELWLYIHRLAVSHLSPLARLYSDEDVIVKHETTLDPLSNCELLVFLRAACSLRLVCRLWSELAKELLYECIWLNVEGCPPPLYSALQQHDTARLVRSVHLSSGHFENNEVVLRLCGPRTKVIVQPDFSTSEKLYAAAWPEHQLPIPPLFALTHIYWVECLWSVFQLNAVLVAAPNLRHLALTSSKHLSSGYIKDLPLQLSPAPVFPPLPHLQTLNVVRLGTDCVHALFTPGSHFGQLRHLTIAPMHLEWAEFPVLRALRVLALVVGSSPTGKIPFPAILGRCPSLEELRYGARDTPVPPCEKQVAAKLLCVRLHLDVQQLFSARRDRRVPSRLHAALLLGSTFHALKRIVLDGPGWSAEEPTEWPEWSLLRENGCRVDGYATGTTAAK